jgi:DNA-directed RNA polymerase subunit omega
MGRSAEEAKNMVGNRYDLVLIASARVRELRRGDKPKFINREKNTPTVTALKEIEQGLVGREYLDRLAQKKR